MKYKVGDIVRLANYDGNIALFGNVYDIIDQYYHVRWNDDAYPHADACEYSIEYLDKHINIRLATNTEIVLFGNKGYNEI